MAVSMIEKNNKNGVIVTDNYIQLDGRIYRRPNCVQNSFLRINIIEGDRIYINGYEFSMRTKKFKRNILTFLKCLFY